MQTLQRTAQALNCSPGKIGCPASHDTCLHKALQNFDNAQKMVELLLWLAWASTTGWASLADPSGCFPDPTQTGESSGKKFRHPFIKKNELTCSSPQQAKI